LPDTPEEDGRVTPADFAHQRHGDLRHQRVALVGFELLIALTDRSGTAEAGHFLTASSANA
jgi:hypothetical protein